MHEIWGRKILRNILFGSKFSCGKCYLLTTWLVGAFDNIGILAPTSISLSIFLHLNICNRTTEMFQNWIFLQKVSHSPSVYISLYFYFLPLFALLPDKLGFAPRREVLQQFRDIRQTLATPWQEMCFTIAMVGFVILQFFILRTFPSISLG